MRLGIPVGGYCPLGYRAEDGVIPERYRQHLEPTLSSSYAPRTRLNVEKSDATIVFLGLRSPGSMKTIGVTRWLLKPCLVLDLPWSEDWNEGWSGGSELVAEFLEKHQPQILNVAGNRESVFPGIQKLTEAILVAAMKG